MKSGIQIRIAGYIFAGFTAAMLQYGAGLYGADELRVTAPSAGVAVFGVPAQSEIHSALTIESIDALKRAFDKGGRFIPAEDYQLRWAFGRIRERPSGEAGVHERIASLLNADIYLVVSVHQSGGTYTAEARIEPLNSGFESFRRTIRVSSRVAVNIPPKLEKEILKLHRGIPVSASVIKHLGGDHYLIDAGQWHGLREGGYDTESRGRIEIQRTSRYEAVAKIRGDVPENAGPLSIRVYPDIDPVIARTDRIISENAGRRYGLDSSRVQGEDPRKRFIEGMCIINPGGNACLPVYGSYLSTSYLGFKDTYPDVPGLALSSASLGMQLMLVPMLSEFSANFFPWVKDDDKSARMQSLHVFLWAAVPVTFTTAYLDQLAVQLKRSELLPPFFEDRDTMAATLSLLFPGGGLFYKGRRLPGWGFYCAEMISAGYGIYHYDTGNTGKYALALFGAIKAADILYAWLARPGYSYYNFETGQEKDVPSLSIGAYRNMGKESIYTAGVSISF